MMSVNRFRTLATAFAGLSILGITMCTSVPEQDVPVKPRLWPKLSSPDLDRNIESRIDGIIEKMTLEQKVGQVVQADSNSVTPQEVKDYRLGSVLSGGNSAPGDEPYADADSWMEAADEYFLASKDTEGVEVAIPIIWGIDAVHGHANLAGATVFPHNIGLGAANNPDLIEEIMEVTASELILSGHDWTFAPTLAVPQDVRWGRSYEGFSESPDIVGSYGASIVYGLQGRPGTDGFFDETSVISCAKHFIGDGGTTNGRDQGDTAVTEQELRDVHGAGYFPAIEADVKTVMASFNSWNGVKLHGSKSMLTDVLKKRLGFKGFVVGDWNGHGQIPGCTNTDCPDALMAGVDMYMAPDSWKGIYESLLSAVESEEVPMSRLDDAVRRILRVKIQAGVFEKPKPSERAGANNRELLGSAKHREVARRAVRESLVLLKNNAIGQSESGKKLLPLNPKQTILVVGDGADNISKQAGGWTLSWQGGGYRNSDFPNGQSILDGIMEVVGAAGGNVIFAPEGMITSNADVVIAVYGEDPYAEFMGDRDHLDFEPNGFDTSNLARYRDQGIPVVSVFLSGRPMWVNPELNASDAFVAAWLPGTEGGGIADLLFESEEGYDFTGRLSFTWPASAKVDKSMEQEVLFDLGYGLSYSIKPEDPRSEIFASSIGLQQLSEDSGLSADQMGQENHIFRQGGTLTPWKAYLVSNSEGGAIFNGVVANITGLTVTRTDHLAQEDAIAVKVGKSGVGLQFVPDGESMDWSAQLDDGYALAFAFKSLENTYLSVGIECSSDLECSSAQRLRLPAGDWREVKVPLSCLSSGVDFANIQSGVLFSTDGMSEFSLSEIRLEESGDVIQECSDL